MNKRAIQVVRVLYEKSGWVTANVIAATIGCSVRSVKSHIADLNAVYPQLLHASRSGYRLNDRDAATQLLQGDPSSIPQDAYERKTWLLMKFLISDQSLQIEALAQEMCVSYQTLKKILNQIKPHLAVYELVLKTKNDAAYIQGSEKSKRDMLIDMIYEDIPDFLSDPSQMHSFLPNVDAGTVRSIVDEVLEECQYSVDDYSLTHMVLDLSVSIEQSMHTPESDDTGEFCFPEAVPGYIIKFFTLLKERIHAYFHITLTSRNLYDLALLMSTRISHQDPMTDISPEVIDLVQQIQRKVKLIFGMDLAQPDSMARFALHLQNLLVRMKNDVRLKNPQLSMIRNTYPFIYEIAVVVSEVISDQIGQSIPEDEISFLAIYIGVLLQEQRTAKNSVRAVLVCPVYSTTHTSLVNRLNAIFSESMTISAICRDGNELDDQKNYDFIITTVPLPKPPLGKPIKYISLHPVNEDIIAINEEIIHQRILHMRDVFQQDLSRLFIDDFYFYNAPFSDDTEAITFLADALYEKGYVDENFKQMVFQREKISTSALANIAIPHPLKSCSKKSAIAVAIQPKGIPWRQKNTVNLILMLSICEDDKLLFHDIFEFVSEFISDSSNLLALMRAQTNTQFKELIASFIATKLND